MKTKASQAAVGAFRAMAPVTVPACTGGVYVARLETDEIKVGSAIDVNERMVAIGRELRQAKPSLLAVVPGYRQVESDLHARFEPHLSRKSGPLSTEIYRMAPEVLEVVERIRATGFTEQDLASGMHRGASCVLRFDDGQTMTLFLSYLPLLGFGEVVPRHMLMRPCRACGEMRNSLEFLGRHELQRLGRQRRVYVVLSDAGDSTCCHCRPKRLVVPAAQAFPGGVTSLRLGTVLDRAGEVVEGFDRDYQVWRPLREHGIRRMSKDVDEPEPGATPPRRAWREGEASLLRLQPYSLRPCRPVAPGYDDISAEQLRLWTPGEQPEPIPQVF